MSCFSARRGRGTRLARHLAILLPAMSLVAALETARIPRVAGRTEARTAVITTRPFRAPHHTISAVGVIGGGQRPLPGAVSLAHHGIVFRDERPEFKRHVLEVLRQPLKDRVTKFLCLRYHRSHGAGDADADRHGLVRTLPWLADAFRLTGGRRGVQTSHPPHTNQERVWGGSSPRHDPATGIEV
jgi:hypothetical protein